MAEQRDLFANFDRMRREMDELFGDVWGEAGWPPAGAQPGFSPAGRRLLLRRAAAEAVVKVELPGVDLDAVSLEIGGRELVITGERPVQETEGRVYQQVEIAAGPFRRVVELSADVDAERGQGDLRGRRPAGRAAAPLQRPGRAQVPIERDGVDGGSAPGRERDGRGRAADRGRRDRPTSRTAIRERQGQPLPDALPVLPLREMVTYPRHADAAGGRPGALDQARQRRPLGRPDAGDGRLRATPSSTSPGPTTSTTSASPGSSPGC